MKQTSERAHSKQGKSMSYARRSQKAKSVLIGTGGIVGVKVASERVPL